MMSWLLGIELPLKYEILSCKYFEYASPLVDEQNGWISSVVESDSSDSFQIRFNQFMSGRYRI